MSNYLKYCVDVCDHRHCHGVDVFDHCHCDDGDDDDDGGDVYVFDLPCLFYCKVRSVFQRFSLHFVLSFNVIYSHYLFFRAVLQFQIGASITGNSGLGVLVGAGGLSGMCEGCNGLGVLNSVGLQPLPVLRVGTGLGLLQVSES